MKTTIQDLARMDPDEWLERRKRERRRHVRLMRLRLAIPFAILSVLMLVFQVYVILIWALLATVLVSYLAAGRKGRP